MVLSVFGIGRLLGTAVTVGSGVSSGMVCGVIVACVGALHVNGASGVLVTVSGVSVTS